MGAEARAEKWRMCPVCKVELPQTANELRTHVHVCKRMAAIGLSRPGRLARPSLQEVVDTQDDQ